MHGYLRLGEVSGNSENAQNLAVLLGFTKASFFPFYTNLQLLLHFANLPHKFLFLLQRLGQVSLNSKNIQNLAVVHGFIKASSFSFYTNFMLLLRLANLPHKLLGLDQRLGQVSTNSENVKKFSCIARFYYSNVCFAFIQTCSYYYAQQIYLTNSYAYTNIWFNFVEF